MEDCLPFNRRQLVCYVIACNWTFYTRFIRGSRYQSKVDKNPGLSNSQTPQNPKACSPQNRNYSFDNMAPKPWAKESLKDGHTVLSPKGQCERPRHLLGGGRVLPHCPDNQGSVAKLSPQEVPWTLRAGQGCYKTEGCTNGVLWKGVLHKRVYLNGVVQKRFCEKGL